MDRAGGVEDLERLALAAQLLPDPLLVRSGQGVILGCNDAFARLCGARPGDLQGKPWREALPSGIIRAFSRADRHGAVVLFMLSVSDREGRKHNYALRQVRHEAEGQILGWVSVARDVTRYSRDTETMQLLQIAEAFVSRSYQDLQKSFAPTMERLARAMGARGSFVFQIHRERRVLRLLCQWWQEGLRNHPVPEEQPLKSAWWEDVREKGAPLLGYPLKSLLPGGTGEAGEAGSIYPVYAQKEILGVLVLVEPRSQEGHLPELVATLLAGVIVRRDIEKLLNAYSADLEKRVQERTSDLNVAYETLKQTQVQLVQADKMASIGQLAAGIAHEINNPIGFIKSNASTLVQHCRLVAQLARQEEPPPAGDELGEVLQEIQEMAGDIQEGTRRVEDIVGNLRTFARMEDGHQAIAQLNELIETSLRVINNELKYKVTVHRDYGDLPEIPCRPDRLNQVFVNLLVNAAQAIEDQGDIWITTGLDEDQVMIQISDNGPGIPPEHQSRIFDPFFTTKDVGKGTGLGLSIVWDIIRSHRGTIVLESAPGQGASFTISLPVHNEGLSVEEVMRDF
ncbi:PAS domain S-box-containing protein [Alkalispirochaeta americana]|uniref:histidine kinase n=1 Tax=Alkalispirochaeta americana TaxID=159291 RepID=A0A1N6XGK8_9SPIO|nr:ATP-binding protein [Alkalispirochaeta americana]SIR01482.1 PAS domain S-box-containing protein [Alkalispirochaeta americana]